MTDTSDILLVLLHPFPMDGSFWGPAWRELDRNVTVLTPEFPGFGGAPSEPEATIASFADDVARAIGEHGGRATVCGLSLGGYVALALVARHPERVRALVLANTRAEADGAEARAGRDRGFDTVRIDGLDAFLNGLIPKLVRPDAPAAVVDHVWAIAGEQDPEAVCGALMALRDRPDRVAELGAIAVPTLVIAGEHDQITPDSAIDTLVAGIPGATKGVIADAGHLSALEQPEAFAALLRGFMASLPS